MGFCRIMALLLATQIFDFRSFRTVFQKDFTEQNDFHVGKSGQFLHSTECVIEYKESHCPEINGYEA